ncbi:hypothetical protein JST97_24915 [bacterium]|nr:hypothetical protein [bacterium]
MLSKLNGFSPLSDPRVRSVPVEHPVPHEQDRFESTPVGWKPWAAVSLSLMGAIPGMAAARPAQAQVQVTWTSPVRYPSQVTEALKPLQEEVLVQLQSARAERRAALALPEGAQRDRQLSAALQKLEASLELWQGLFQVHNGLEQMSSDDPYIRWEGAPRLNEAESALQKAAQHYRFFEQKGQQDLVRVHNLVNKLSWEDTFAPPGLKLQDAPWAQHATTQDLLQVLSNMNVADGRAGNGGAEALAEATQELAQLRQQAWAMPHASADQEEARSARINEVAQESEAHRHRRNGAFQMHLQLQRLNLQTTGPA